MERVIQVVYSYTLSKVTSYGLPIGTLVPITPWTLQINGVIVLIRLRGLAVQVESLEIVIGSWEVGDVVASKLVLVEAVVASSTPTYLVPSLLLMGLELLFGLVLLCFDISNVDNSIGFGLEVFELNIISLTPLCGLLGVCSTLSGPLVGVLKGQSCLFISIDY